MLPPVMASPRVTDLIPQDTWQQYGSNFVLHAKGGSALEPLPETPTLATILVTDRDRVAAELGPLRETRSPVLADAFLAGSQHEPPQPGGAPHPSPCEADTSAHTLDPVTIRS